MSAKKRQPKDETFIEEEIQPIDEHEVSTPQAPSDGQDVETTEGQEENPLVAQLDLAEARAAEYLDSLQRERAAFQNYKRRVEREREDQAHAASGRLLIKLLPVLDDFYRAMDLVPEGERDQWFAGMAMILRKLERFLQDEGVTEIAALGQPFDPNFHEAVGVDSGVEDVASGSVTAVLQRGYQRGERVLRPAMVRVAE